VSGCQKLRSLRSSYMAI